MIKTIFHITVFPIDDEDTEWKWEVRATKILEKWSYTSAITYFSRDEAQKAAEKYCNSIAQEEAEEQRRYDVSLRYEYKPEVD